MRKLLLISLFTAFGMTELQAEVPSGVYQTAPGDSGGWLHVRIASCANDTSKSCGQIIQAFVEDGSISAGYEHLGKAIVWGMEDKGNGRWGGSIENPVFVTAVPYPVGATHAAFPYAQESTGKFYLFLGDEISGGRGAAWAGQGADNQRYDPASGEGGVQGRMSGYLHIIDFTDPENPRDVARYEVPEAGAHNLWVEEDVLYQAYYKGGLRVVDVSGELMGDLMAQGREIAIYKPQDPGGFLPQLSPPNATGKRGVRLPRREICQ